MLLFLLGMFILIAGYFTYGKFIEKIIGPDDRETPGKRKYDGVDFVIMPHWKNMLIQLLNIAGVGPVIGVIIGIKFGVIAFLIIPIGNIIMGAVHDFVAGMMSMRYDGANLPYMIRKAGGKWLSILFSIFMCLLLLIVVAVFINIPANLIDSFWPDIKLFWVGVGSIFIYYIIAAMFPVDKIIGKIYPLFGAMLIIGSFLIFIALMVACVNQPDLLTETPAFKAGMFTSAKNPIIPMLFVTIACGIISGFHATQSTIIARTMEHEKQARSSFYGMMVVEGIIAMIWAAAGLAIYNLFPTLLTANPNNVLVDLTKYFLGEWCGSITIISVIILAITSGDTALRSLRLSVAEIFNIPQKSFRNRFWLMAIFIVFIVLLLWWSNQSAESFRHLWNYFAWSNQVLAACTLSAVTVWLIANKKPGIYTMLPGLFMTFVVVSFILWTSPAHGGPVGFGLDLNTAYILSGIITFIVMIAIIIRGKSSIGKM